MGELYPALAALPAALRDEVESHQRTDLQLQQVKAQADAANQAKSRYITAISHELRTPLNSILGYAQILAAEKALMAPDEPPPEEVPPPSRIAARRFSSDSLASWVRQLVDDLVRSDAAIRSGPRILNS